MTDVLYHPLIDRDTDGLDKSPLFCSPDRERSPGPQRSIWRSWSQSGIA